MAAGVTDPHAALATPRKLTVAEEVKLQLGADYPASALGWVDDLAWAPGPVMVPVSRIDQKSGNTDWSKARQDKVKIAQFIDRIRSGVRKPVVLVRHPGSPLLFAADGHTRIVASQAIGQPVAAWVGTAKTADGPWRTMHQKQAAKR
jgi:hypothetical protein